ncbi:MAG: TonB-dependent receptor, partial [Acetobacteraceae bacterium]|nr:TonB-dependent receptor [Acetobacteraceae bacterium]
GQCGTLTGATPAAAAAANVANISRVTTFLQNGAKQTNEGLDLVVNYRQNHMFDSDVRLGIGGSATRVFKNSITDVSVAGVLVQRGFNGVGLLNYQSALYPVPKWKGQAFVDFGFGPIDMRLQGNYTGGLHDQRADTNSGPFALNNDLGGVVLTQGANIRRFVTADYNIQIQLPANVVLTGTVANLFDRDPPFAREDYNYEPFIGNPLGRTVKVGASVKF